MARFTVKAAVYLLLFRDNQILLQRRYKTGWMDGKYSLVAGHIDGNESVFGAMIREASEEIGITIKGKDLIPVTVLHRKSPDEEYIDFFFTTKHWKGEPMIMEPNKCDDVSWFSLNKLPENLLPYVKTALENYKTNIPFSATGWK